jgi:hypothetical protein
VSQSYKACRAAFSILGAHFAELPMRTIALFFVTAVVHAAPAPDWSWLAGDWRRCQDGEIVEERWLGPRGEMMIGANLTSSPKGKATFENLRIARSDDSWTFWAAPGGRPAVPFRMVEGGAERAVFANPEHVFPARISYWREGDALLARIEGTIQDKPRSIEWRFARGTAADCPLAR